LLLASRLAFAASRHDTSVLKVVSILNQIDKKYVKFVSR